MTASWTEHHEQGRLRFGEHNGTYQVNIEKGVAVGHVDLGDKRARFECDPKEVDDTVITAFRELVKRANENKG